MLDILRTQVDKWLLTVLPHGQDDALDLDDDGLWIALHIDGGLRTVKMMRSMEYGDYDYVVFCHAMVDDDRSLVDYPARDNWSCRPPTDDEQGDAFLKLLAAMA